MTENKEFFKYAKEYALNKLTAAYQNQKALPLAKAHEQAEKHLAMLTKPVESCDIHNSKTTLSAIYHRLLVSCQNRAMMPTLIKFDANRKVFAKLLIDFNPVKVLEKYKSADDLFNVFNKSFDINQDHNKLWKLFAQSVMDSAKFLTRFINAEDFKKTIDNIATNSPAIMAVPNYICEEIHGLGPVLACDFIKEIGYVEYAKPDVHIEYIIVNYFYDGKKVSPKEILNKVQEIAKDAGVSTFEVDKILWLIASGKYYDVKQIEPTIIVKSEHSGQSLRDEFLEKLSSDLIRF